MGDWFIAHSAKGSTWKSHKYIRKDGNTYVYANSDTTIKTSRPKTLYGANSPKRGSIDDPKKVSAARRAKSNIMTAGNKIKRTASNIRKKANDGTYASMVAHIKAVAKSSLRTLPGTKKKKNSNTMYDLPKRSYNYKVDKDRGGNRNHNATKSHNPYAPTVYKTKSGATITTGLGSKYKNVSTKKTKSGATVTTGLGAQYKNTSGKKKKKQSNAKITSVTNGRLK